MAGPSGCRWWLGDHAGHEGVPTLVWGCWWAGLGVLLPGVGCSCCAGGLSHAVPRHVGSV